MLPQVQRKSENFIMKNKKKGAYYFLKEGLELKMDEHEEKIHTSKI